MQWNQIPVEKFAQFSWKQLQQIPYDQLSRITQGIFSL
jgi:hypothetical protein